MLSNVLPVSVTFVAKTGKSILDGGMPREAHTSWLLRAPQVFDIELEGARAIPLVRLQGIGDIEPGILFKIAHQLAEPECNCFVGWAAMPIIEPQFEMLAIGAARPCASHTHAPAHQHRL